MSEKRTNWKVVILILILVGSGFSALAATRYRTLAHEQRERADSIAREVSRLDGQLMAAAAEAEAALRRLEDAEAEAARAREEAARIQADARRVQRQAAAAAEVAIASADEAAAQLRRQLETARLPTLLLDTLLASQARAMQARDDEIEGVRRELFAVTEDRDALLGLTDELRASLQAQIDASLLKDELCDELRAQVAQLEEAYRTLDRSINPGFFGDLIKNVKWIAIGAAVGWVGNELTSSKSSTTVVYDDDYKSR